MIKLPQKVTLLLTVAELESKKPACWTGLGKERHNGTTYTVGQSVHIFIYFLIFYLELFAPRFCLLWKTKGPDSDLTEHVGLCIATT